MFDLAEILKKGELILNEVRSIRNEILEKDKKAKFADLPINFINANEKIKIVFVGQYSAGKSSLVKMLTKNEAVRIGAGITTDEATCYDWTSSIEIVDTPGVDAGNPVHDKKSLQAIANADLLVFVITPNLFNDVIGNHFREIAYDNNKADEMILVVNKMDMVGNDDERRDILKRGMAEVLSPRSVDDYHVCFTDAKSYLKYLELGDIPRGRRKLEASGFELFVKKLNDFAREQGFIGQLTTPAFQVQKVISDMIEYLDTPIGDIAIDSYESYLRRQKKVYVDVKTTIKNKTDNCIEKYLSDIHKEGERVVSFIKADAEQKLIEEESIKANNNVEGIIKKCDKEIQDIIEKSIEQMEDDFKELEQSPFVVELKKTFDVKKGKVPPFLKKINKSNVDKLCKHLEGLGPEELKTIAATLRGALKKIGLERLSDVFKFKPWGAKNLSKTLGKLSKWIPVLSVLLDLFLEHKEEQAEQKYLNALREYRDQVRQSFSTTQRGYESHIKSVITEFLKDNIDNRIAEYDDMLGEFIKEKGNTDQKLKDLQELQISMKQLVNEIHYSAKD